ncbi:MAG: transcription elongation factor GreA [Micrococcaceae bacterium]
MDDSTSWLTQESYDRLTKELEELEGPKRAEIVKRIELAREEGDLKENGGYHAAREEQGKIEGRINQLKNMLENAQVGEAPISDTVVPGVVVVATIAGDPEEFLLGNREIAEDTDIDVYSEHSPLGQAVLGLKKGDKASYTAPNGKEIKVQVKGIKPFTG